MTTKVKKKMDYKERLKQHDEIDERLKKKEYVLTVYQTGHHMMSGGDSERQVFPRRFWVNCSLEEIPEYIKWMKQPFWYQPKGLTKKEIKDYPLEKKEWGIYTNVVIEPLSEELEKSYLSASKEEFFAIRKHIQEEEDLGKS